MEEKKPQEIHIHYHISQPAPIQIPYPYPWQGITPPPMWDANWYYQPWDTNWYYQPTHTTTGTPSWKKH